MSIKSVHIFRNNHCLFADKFVYIHNEGVHYELYTYIFNWKHKIMTINPPPKLLFWTWSNLLRTGIGFAFEWQESIHNKLNPMHFSIEIIKNRGRRKIYYFTFFQSITPTAGRPLKSNCRMSLIEHYILYLLFSKGKNILLKYKPFVYIYVESCHKIFLLI